MNNCACYTQPLTQLNRILVEVQDKHGRWPLESMNGHKSKENKKEKKRSLLSYFGLGSNESHASSNGANANRGLCGLVNLGNTYPANLI